VLYAARPALVALQRKANQEVRDRKHGSSPASKTEAADEKGAQRAAAKNAKKRVARAKKWVARKKRLKKLPHRTHKLVWNAQASLADGGSRVFGLPLHRRYLPQFLNKLGLTGWGAEIGVKQGVHAQAILERWEGKKLFLVDPWEEQDNTYFDHANVDQLTHNRFYEATLTRMRPFGGRFEILRDYSVGAAERITDGSLDFVYLDARHDYDSVLEDLHAWEPKVKVGGLVAGHDFLRGKMNGVPFGVKLAVRHYFKERGYRRWILRRTWEPFPSFYYIKPSVGRNGRGRTGINV